MSEYNEYSLAPSNAGNVASNAAKKQIANPFGSSPVELGRASAVANVQAASREVAEMQAQIFLAKQFPRDQQKAVDKILTACQRPGLASAALYSYSRSGSEISGPSIRLAEEIARNWGNLECGWNELERAEHSSKICAYAWDKETNVYKKLIFVVSHMRHTKSGSYALKDERDIYEHLANNAARRMRNCILALVPGDVVEAACEQCLATMQANCDVTPDGIKKLVGAFGTLGVTKQMIEGRIQRRIDAIAPAQVIKMRQIFASLKDGMSEVGDWFEKEEEIGATTSTDKIKAELSARKTKTSTAKGSTKTESKTETNALNETFDANAPTTPLDELRRTILAAKTSEELQAAANEVAAKINSGVVSENERDRLFDLVEQQGERLSD